ncbi:phage minor head protein [Photobacterium sanguinicancri]|uniref:phage minor head protein n=1 Tax=Photobacterium sanguinicancri TaxID=875932 RepID=UPI0026E37A8A|nr:phage minor head protein [Photobacterium sanguinicancri]MDO6497337.1 phage minor head protein [Photobacterium sanguinicancri]
MPVQYGSLPFNEQIAFFRHKTNIPAERWADLWQNAHDRGFMVAGAMKDDLLADFRGAVDKAISEGKSVNWFQSQFNDIVKRHGWEHTGSASWRSQVIYQTNVRQSYTAGREQQIEQVKSRRPYGIYKHSGSEHPRHDHLFWNNLVIPLDDPWWDTHTPINGYGCKCKKFTASGRDLKRLGLEVTGAPKVETYEWTDKVTGEVHKIPKGIDPGFDYTPKTSQQLTENTQRIIDAKPPLNERLTPRAVDHAFSTVKKVNAIELSRVIDALATPQVSLFADFMRKHNTKTLFIKQSEMAGKQKARAIAEQVEEYLVSGYSHPAVLYMSRHPTRTNGFTSRRWQHVVVKAKSTDSLKAVSAPQLTEAVEKVLAMASKPWSISEVTRQLHGSSAGVVATWAHEVGHQVYFRAGRPSISHQVWLTRYSQHSDDEWFAEHFAAWLIAPVQLKQQYPQIFEFITNIISKTL